MTIESLFTAARQSDGSLPVNKPLRLTSTSDLIDAGTSKGHGDDIGYDQYSAAAAVPTSQPRYVQIVFYKIVKIVTNTSAVSTTD